VAEVLTTDDMARIRELLLVTRSEQPTTPEHNNASAELVARYATPMHDRLVDLGRTAATFHRLRERLALEASQAHEGAARALAASLLSWVDEADLVAEERTSETSDRLPIGSLLPWLSEADPPPGWVLCRGQTLAVAAHPALADLTREPLFTVPHMPWLPPTIMKVV